MNTSTKKGAWILGALLAAMSVSCGDDVPSKGPFMGSDSSGGKPVAGATGLSGEIIAITSAAGKTNGLSATGPTGMTPLNPGDKITQGEAITTTEGLEAEILLSDGTFLNVEERSRIKLVEFSVQVEQGSVFLTRPHRSGGEIPVRAGGGEFSLGSGRAYVTADSSGSRIQVHAGEITDRGTKQTFGSGKELAVSQTGSLVLTSRRPSSTPARIAPFAPEAYRVPPPRNLLRGIGTLTARLPGSGKKNETALALDRHAVDVTIRDGVALTRIEEAFTNNSGRTVEGTYRFLLPSSASITRLALDVNGRIEEGEVLEKKRAKRIFKQIVDESVRPRDPALMEWVEGNTFTMKIFPIKPGETRRVFISYMEPMTSEDGTVRYVYPLGGSAGSPDIGEFSIKVDLQSNHGLGAIRSPLYPTKIQARGENATAEFAAMNYAPRADFVLEYGTRQEVPELRVASETEKSGRSYAMALFKPQIQPSSKASPPKRILAVVDTSYGTPQEIRALSTATAVELLAGLGPADTFNVLACDSGCAQFERGFTGITPDTFTHLGEYLASLEPGGASDILGAMSQAFTQAGDRLPTTVVYIGDGIPTSGERNQAKLLNLLEEIRPSNVAVETVAVGPNTDERFLATMASRMGGTSYRLSIGEAPALAAWNLARRIHSEGLSDVRISWPAGAVDPYPTRIGFIPAGSEVVLTSALARPGITGDIVITGTMANGSKYEKRFALDAFSGPSAPGFISKLWAKERIETLQFQGGDPKEIVSLSRRSRVASRLTSWIVLENQRMYDRFNVQRTDAETWDGTGAVFQTAAGEEEEAAEELEALDSLAALDSEDGAEDSLLGAVSGVSTAGGGLGSGGVGKGEALNASKPKKKASGSAPAPAPAAAAPAPWADEKEAKKSMKSKASKPKADMDDAFDPSDESAYGPGIATGSASWEQSGRKYAPYCKEKTVTDIKIGGPLRFGAAAQNKADKLGANARLRPLSRAAHRRYVRLLSKLGSTSEALLAAEVWKDADPMGNGALASLADQTARHGNRNAAMRLYSSIAEIDADSKKVHVRVARAFKDLDLYGFAAGHYRAAADLDKKNADRHMMDYFFCLAASNQHALFFAEHARVLGDPKWRKLAHQIAPLASGLQSGVLPPWKKETANGAMVVSFGDTNSIEDLDLAIIDPAGRLISGLWRKGATVSDMNSPEEKLALASLMNGNYQIVVTRSSSVNSRPVSGTVSVKVKNKRRRLSFSLTGSQAVVGNVNYKKRTQTVCSGPRY